MPPGVKLGPVKGSTLVKDAQNRDEGLKADEKRGAELQVIFSKFVKAVEGLQTGDYVKLRDDDYKVLQRELEAFLQIEVEEPYASEWEDCMSEMVGKAFRVIRACSHTGQLIIDALPGSRGSTSLRESTWSQRFILRFAGGNEWLLPATAFQKLQVEVRGHCGHELHFAELGWYQGFINSRQCHICNESISRSSHRFRCEEKCCFVCPECFNSKCKETLDGDVLTRTFVYGVGSIRVFLEEAARLVESIFNEGLGKGDIKVSFDEKKLEGSLVLKHVPRYNFSNFNWTTASFQLEVTNWYGKRVMDWKEQFEALHSGVFKIEWSGETVGELPLLGSM